MKRQEDPGDAEAVGKAVCQGNTTNMKELSAKLKLSLEYYQSIGTKKKETTCVGESLLTATITSICLANTVLYHLTTGNTEGEHPKG